MKKIYLACASLLVIVGFVRCSEDNPIACDQSDFVGTYTLVGDSTCTADNTITAPLSFFLTGGSMSNIVLENGEGDLELIITDCIAADDFVSYSIVEGNVISQIGDCQWTYEKN